jgi:hypothetical protein
MSGAIPPFPQYAFMVWYLEHRDNFYFTLRALNGVTSEDTTLIPFSMEEFKILSDVVPHDT